MTRTFYDTSQLNVIKVLIPRVKKCFHTLQEIWLLTDDQDRARLELSFTKINVI